MNQEDSEQNEVDGMKKGAGRIGRCSVSSYWRSSQALHVPISGRGEQTRSPSLPPTLRLLVPYILATFFLPRIECKVLVHCWLYNYQSFFLCHMILVLISVGIDLKNWRVSCRNAWNFAQGLKFKANFHSKMSVCRRELGGGGLNRQPPDHSNPGSDTCRPAAQQMSNLSDETPLMTRGPELSRSSKVIDNNYTKLCAVSD